MGNKASRIGILQQEGWQKQFAAKEPRLSEAVETYKEAGFDVHLEPLTEEAECESRADKEEEEKTCRICFEGFEDQYRIIFTRPKRNK
ncbi:MAG: hypothetical protein GY849_17540 [Deltaproteobacteria bacterium]|nr:hypothetical protein [Deltaproteobacteria bacterium]